MRKNILWLNRLFLLFLSEKDEQKRADEQHIRIEQLRHDFKCVDGFAQTGCGGDGNEHRAIAAKPRDAEVQRLPLRKEQAHGSRISRMPVRQDPRADTGHVLGGGDSDALTCEQDRGLRMEPPRGRPPATEEDDGQKEGALRGQGRAPRVEQAARDVIVVRQNLSGRPAPIRVEIVPVQIN